MHAAACQSAVIEFSREALAERRAAGIGLDTAVLTNLHIASGEHSPRASSRMVDRFLRQRKAGGVAIVNADDHRCRRLIPEISGACLTYGLYSEADIRATVLERHISEQMFLLSAGGESVPVRTRIIGEAHVQNCLAAAAAAVAMGVSLETIARGLEAVDRIPGRMERIECGQPFGVFVDAANSPQKLALSMKSIRQATRGRTFVVFGPHAGVDSTHRALLGRVLERGAHVAVLTSDEPNEQRPLATAHDVLDGFERPQRAHVIPSRAAAIRFALDNAGPGDAVLIAGRGDRISVAASGSEAAYDDREVACEWLYGHALSEINQPEPRARFRVVG
jgi:UDP-N-acetylmuramoyl-L-alanyl-D-glutamate--2,6-diaminopimelate ligase